MDQKEEILLHLKEQYDKTAPGETLTLTIPYKPNLEESSDHGFNPGEINMVFGLNGLSLQDLVEYLDFIEEADSDDQEESEEECDEDSSEDGLSTAAVEYVHASTQIGQSGSGSDRVEHEEGTAHSVQENQNEPGASYPLVSPYIEDQYNWEWNGPQNDEGEAGDWDWD